MFDKGFIVNGFQITFRILKVYQPAMGEIIDTKPIESVKAAVSLFGEKYYQKRNKFPSKDVSTLNFFLILEAFDLVV